MFKQSIREMMKLSLGFSPCPNDTFIFDALVNHKIDTGGLIFETILEDVQTLNSLALNNQLDISKISYGVLPLVLETYLLLESGGALGKGVGPLLVSLPPIDDSFHSIENETIAIPGENTTAHLLFSLAYPNASHKVFKVFNTIENAVLQKEVDAGVIIHENRFTYQQKGLHKRIDLGEYWEETTRLPIPLGGIIAKRTLPIAVLQKVNELIRQSVMYAFGHHYTSLTQYVKEHAQEMSDTVMRQHIDLYVNDYSLSLGDLGKAAVIKLIDVYKQVNKQKTAFRYNDIFI